MSTSPCALDIRSCDVCFVLAGIFESVPLSEVMRTMVEETVIVSSQHKMKGLYQGHLLLLGAGH